MASLARSSSRVAICWACRRGLTRSNIRQHSSSTNTPAEIYDVVTVGGGPVGLALLAALKSSPKTSHLKTALIESQALTKSRSWTLPADQYSNRASSLTPKNVSFLDQIGAWQHIDPGRVQAYDEMQVWDASNEASIQFDWRHEARKYNAPPRTVATMCENMNLTRALLARISELGADHCILDETKVSAISNGENDPEGVNLSSWPLVSISNSSIATTPVLPLAARLLVGADGFNSPVRQYANITSNGWDYDRHGVVATLKLEAQEPSHFLDSNSADMFSGAPDTDAFAHNQATAFQRFLPALGGPLAILPLPGNYASMVWSTTVGNANYLKPLDPDSFVATVNAALRLGQTDIKYLLSLPMTSTNSHADELSWRLEHTDPHPTIKPPAVLSVQEGSVASFPLRFRHVQSLTCPRVALAGDAAHTIHPLAGQGLNLGLADVAALASTIEYAVEHGMDLGDTMALDSYGRARFGAGLKTAAAVDGLNWLYSIGQGGDIHGNQKSLDSLVDKVLSGTRGIGMQLVNMVPGLKEQVMKQAD